MVCWAAAGSPPPWVLAPVPDNSSPTGTSGHFHMELLLQGVGADWRLGPRLAGSFPRAEVWGRISCPPVAAAQVLMTTGPWSFY